MACTFAPGMSVDPCLWVRQQRGGPWTAYTDEYKATGLRPQLKLVLELTDMGAWRATGHLTTVYPNQWEDWRGPSPATLAHMEITQAELEDAKQKIRRSQSLTEQEFKRELQRGQRPNPYLLPGDRRLTVVMGTRRGFPAVFVADPCDPCSLAVMRCSNRARRVVNERQAQWRQQRTSGHQSVKRMWRKPKLRTSASAAPTYELRPPAVVPLEPGNHLTAVRFSKNTRGV